MIGLSFSWDGGTFSSPTFIAPVNRIFLPELSLAKTCIPSCSWGRELISDTTVFSHLLSFLPIHLVSQDRYKFSGLDQPFKKKIQMFTRLYFLNVFKIQEQNSCTHNNGFPNPPKTFFRLWCVYPGWFGKSLPGLHAGALCRVPIKSLALPT